VRAFFQWTAVDRCGVIFLRAPEAGKALHASSRNTSPRSAGRAGRELSRCQRLAQRLERCGPRRRAKGSPRVWPSLLVFAALTVRLDKKWPVSSVNCPELGLFAVRL